MLVWQSCFDRNRRYRYPLIIAPTAVRAQSHDIPTVHCRHGRLWLARCRAEYENPLIAVFMRSRTLSERPQVELRNTNYEIRVTDDASDPPELLNDGKNRGVKGWATSGAMPRRSSPYTRQRRRMTPCRDGIDADSAH